jgi:hypothetical protein
MGSLYGWIKQIIDDLMVSRPVNLYKAICWLMDECGGRGKIVSLAVRGILMFPTKFKYRAELTPANSGQYWWCGIDDSTTMKAPSNICLAMKNGFEVL